ncbi:S41 family peptidase [Lewinella sp. LCG006]|uniref:S41 family peptidase n=1 Tax=Lewinella sp. LCG006 TaxID=3231911 RepID=UPI00345F2EF7
MKNVIRALSFLVLILLLTTCGKWIVGPNPENTVSNNYDYFYRAVKENYSFFGEKQVAWDSLDQVYRPLINDSLSNDSLYSILSTMLFALRDGHVNLYVNNDRSRNADWYLDYPANFNQGFLNRQYWKGDYQSSGALLNTWLTDSIGYVYYGSFRAGFSKGHLDYVLNRFAKAKGLIIDVRENGGGSMRNVFRLVERFVPERTYFGTMQYKSGQSADDFSVPDSVFIKPLVDYKAIAEAKAKQKKKKGKEEEEEKASQEEKTTGPGRWAVADSTGMMLDKPIVVLVNRHSYSATNFFAGYMSTLPNVTLIGDQSGGGGGVPVSFELPNGWTFRISATRTYLPDGYNIEKGIEPDIYQTTGPAEELQGIDAIIEKGKSVILEKAASVDEK